MISNQEENISVDEIKKTMKGIESDKDIAGISVHPTGSTRSKIIKDIHPVLVKNITKRIENKSYKGRLLHCKPHVPVSPPNKKISSINPVKEPKDASEMSRKMIYLD